jgi:hypothetical protein
MLALDLMLAARNALFAGWYVLRPDADERQRLLSALTAVVQNTSALTKAREETAAFEALKEHWSLLFPDGRGPHRRAACGSTAIPWWPCRPPGRAAAG